jgi:hypothetical protein
MIGIVNKKIFFCIFMMQGFFLYSAEKTSKAQFVLESIVRLSPKEISEKVNEIKASKKSYVLLCDSSPGLKQDTYSDVWNMFIWCEGDDASNIEDIVFKVKEKRSDSGPEKFADLVKIYLYDGEKKEYVVYFRWLK